MNTICQDRDITAGALALAGIKPHGRAMAIMCRALEKARFAPQPCEAAGMSTQEQVGKNRGGSWQNFANWIQLANGCQLNSLSNQSLSDFPVQLAVGSWQKLPTELSPCFYSLSTPCEVGEISPSYYVGEGANALSPLRREIACAIDAALPARTVVLAIDLGTTTGWALRTMDGQIAHGSASFKPGRYEGGGMRYLRFKRWLSEMRVLANDIHSVYFEEVRRHVGVDAAHVYGGLLATLTAWCEHHNLPYQGVPVGTIKKHATGKGNASKDEVMQAMRALGHPVTDDNEADALALLHWALKTQEG
jgi:hypothetical protein